MSARKTFARRASLIAMLALALGISGALPALAQDEAAREAVAPDFAGFEAELAQVATPTHQVMPEHLVGETSLAVFENAWRSSYSSIEAAMIANTIDRRAEFPPLPADSGVGERVVYSLSRQRVWMVAEDGFIIDSYLVSGRDWMPNVGSFRVWGKARRTSGYDPSYTMNWMVRFAVGSHGGNIGFHDLPLYRGRPVQTLDDLGTANLSGGCVRQDPYHARMMFAWTEIGTPVEVVP